MRRHHALLTLCVLAALVAPAAHAADGPTPYPDPKADAAWPGKGPIRLHGWMVDNRKHFWTQRAKDQGAVVFVGDSLTGGWKADHMAKSFPGLKVANRGIGGDVTRGVLFRLKEDVLDLKPRAIVLCIGTNDLSTHAEPAVIASNVSLILAQIRQHDANLPVVLCNIPPRDHKDAPTKPNAVADLNARLAKLAETANDAHLKLVDLHTPLAGPDGRPKPDSFAKDRLHLAPPGYDQWATALGPAFEALGIK
ncbi:MAG TPA: GDSL-type esterase/lipase family protein [Tepidisphaeraceae bacterium]|nr:GDSL-type esterase/lipase family protein [Tepidisphaeraceae bacterium]